MTASMALANEDELPLDYDPEFLLTLDTGGQENSMIVACYELSWWTGRKPRDLDAVEILNASTVSKCLQHYKRRLGLDAGASRNADASGNAGSSVNTGITSNAAGTGTSSNNEAGAECRSCLKYRELLSDVLQDILKFQNFASSMSSSSQNLFEIGNRRASTFNLLHEAAILKETAGLSPPAPDTTSCRISAVIQNASSELQRLRDLPASSYKWTWGETLTEKEVLNLRRTGTKPDARIHSGYGVDLGTGKEAGDYSSIPFTIPSSNGQHDDLPAEAGFAPPSTDHALPKYFSKPDHRRVYDPLQISDSKINPIPDTTSGPEDLMSALNLADAWSTGSGSHTGIDKEGLTALALAENWSGSDSVSRTSPKNIAARHQLADGWSSGSDTSVRASRHQLAEGWTSDSCTGRVPAHKTKHLMADNVLLADSWVDDEDNEQPSGPSTLSALCLADEWTDNHVSGDEGSPTALSTALRLAEAWGNMEEANEASEPAVGNDNWKYGPEHFSFLQDKMFENSSDEEE
jgi:hypothetical protein